jgi:hypothetical protein
VLTDGRLTGLVTDRDITVRVLAENRDPRPPPSATSAAANWWCSARTTTWPGLPAGPRSRGAPHSGAAGRDPVGVVSVGDLALESGATSAMSGMSSAPPND